MFDARSESPVSFPVLHFALCISLVAIALRVAVGVSLEGSARFPDSRDYIAIARNIRAGHGPRLSEHTVAKRAPGYPYFLAAIFSVFQKSSLEEPPVGGPPEIEASISPPEGSDFELRTPASLPLGTVRLTQALLGGLLCLVVYAIGSRLFGPVAGIAAAALVALDPFLTYLSGLILTETLFALLLTAAFACLIYSENGKLYWAAACGLLLGGAALVRASMLVMIPVPAALWAALHWKKPRPVATAAAAVALSLAVVSPWAIRNYRLTGRAVFTTLSGGASLYEGTCPGADGGPAMDKLDWPPEIETMGEVAKDAFLFRKAVGFMKSDPLRILGLAFIKLQRFWSIFPNFSEYRRPVFMAISALYMVPVMILTVAGIFVSVKAQRPQALVLLVPAAYFSALHAIFVGSIRYRAPVMPLLAVFAGAAVAAVHGKVRARRRQPSDSGAATGRPNA